MRHFSLKGGFLDQQYSRVAEGPRRFYLLLTTVSFSFLLVLFLPLRFILTLNFA